MSLAEHWSWINMKLIVRIFELCGYDDCDTSDTSDTKKKSIRNEFWYRIWYRDTKMVSRYQKGIAIPKSPRYLRYQKYKKRPKERPNYCGFYKKR